MRLDRQRRRLVAKMRANAGFRIPDDIPPAYLKKIEAIERALLPRLPGSDEGDCVAILFALMRRVRAWGDPERIKEFASTLEPAVLEFCADERAAASDVSHSVAGAEPGEDLGGSMR